MLADSLPLPLVIDDVDHSDSITVQDDEGILLALRHRNRVRCIRLDLPVPKLYRLVMVSEDEFPILEYLFLGPPSRQHTGETFRVASYTTSTPPRAMELCISSTISITGDFHGSRHTIT